MSSTGSPRRRSNSSRKGLRKSSVNAGFRGSLVTTVKPFTNIQPIETNPEGVLVRNPRKSNPRRKSSRRASFKKSYVRYVRKSKNSFTRVSISRRSSFPKRKSSIQRRKSDPGSTNHKRVSDVSIHDQPTTNIGFRGSLRLSVGLLPNVQQAKRSTLTSPRDFASPTAPLSYRGSVVTIAAERVIISREGKRGSQPHQGFRGSLCSKRFSDRHGSFTLLDYKEPLPPAPDIIGVGLFESTSDMAFIIPEPQESLEISSYPSPRHPGTEGYLKNAGFRQASLGGQRPSAPTLNESLAVRGTTRPYASRELAVPHFRGSLTKTGRRASIHIHPRL